MSSVTERYSLFPIKDEESYKAFKMQECAMWSVNEIKFVEDIPDYQSLTKRQKRPLDIALAFFLPGDGLVNKNIVLNFMNETRSQEEFAAYAAQLYIETIHAETYGLIVNTLYTEEKIAEMAKMCENSKYMKAKFDFIEKWIHNDRPFVEKLLAFACVEGISFSVLFAVIFWYRKMGKMKALIFANALIAADESMHRNYACYLIMKYGGISEERANEIIGELYGIEVEFIEWMIDELEEEDGKEDNKEDELGDLTSDNLKEFLKLVTDSLRHRINLPTLFNAKNNMKWLDDIALIQKENFFEIKGANYTRTSVSDAVNWKLRCGKVKTNEKVFTDPSSVDF